MAGIELVEPPAIVAKVTQVTGAIEKQIEELEIWVNYFTAYLQHHDPVTDILAKVYKRLKPYMVIQIGILKSTLANPNKESIEKVLKLETTSQLIVQLWGRIAKCDERIHNLEVRNNFLERQNRRLEDRVRGTGVGG